MFYDKSLKIAGFWAWSGHNDYFQNINTFMLIISSSIGKAFCPKKWDGKVESILLWIQLVIIIFSDAHRQIIYDLSCEEL